MLNKNLESPTVRSLAYDVDMKSDRPLRGIDIFADGGLVVIDSEGTQVLYTITGVTGGPPYRLILQIRNIVGNGSGAAGNGTTGTNIALANLVGLH